MDKQNWIKLWQECKGSVYQSLEFATLREKLGKNPIFITIEDENILKAGILAFEQVLLTPIGKKKILAAEGTPLFLKKEYGLRILEKFKEISKDYFYGTIAPTVINSENELFLKAGFKKIVNFTVLINLQNSEDNLFQSLEKKSSRWGVKFAEKNNLIFQEATSQDIERLYSLYQQTTSEGKFNAEPKDFFHNLINSGVGKIFIVKREKEILAGCAILTSNDYNILNITTSSEEGHKFQAMPFLYWNTIKYSKSLGRKYFDLGGYDKEAKEGDKTHNINKFKERFGGEIIEQPIYSTNSKYSFFRNVIKKFKFIKKLYRKD